MNDDIISRQIAIDAVYGLIDESCGEYAENPHIDAIVEMVENLPTADVIERSKIDEAIGEIIEKSFCSDMLNDKTEMELVKLDDVLEILKSIWEVSK